MRIAQIMINKDFGGAERAFVDTCIALADQGHDVLAMTDAKAQSRAYFPAHPHLTIAAIRLWGRNDLFAKRVAGKTIAAFQPEIDFCIETRQFAQPPLLVAASSPRGFGRP